MTLEKETRLRKQDKKLYDLKKNKDFLKKHKEMLKNGYNPILSIDGMQYLIDYIVNWYEIKYPDIELNEYASYTGYLDVEPIAKYLDIRQLLSRLGPLTACFMRCNYRGVSGRRISFEDSSGNISECTALVFDISYGQESHYIYVNNETGLVRYDEKVYWFYRTPDVYFEDLLNLSSQMYNLSSVKRCLQLHNQDIELRDNLIKLAALKMVYSENTIPNLGIKRAKLFLKEMHDDLNMTYAPEFIPTIKESNNDANLPTDGEAKQLTKNDTRKITKSKIK